MRPAYSQLQPKYRAAEVVLSRKFCSGCGRWRQLCDFACYHDRRAGIVRLRAACRACYNLAIRRRTQRMTAKEIELRREYQRFWCEGKRREQGIPPRPRRKPPPRGGALLDPAPLIVELRRAKVSQKQLARRAGVPPRAIYRVLKGESRRVQLDVADKLAVALGIPLSILYPDGR